MFQGNVLHPSQGAKSKPNNQEEAGRVSHVWRTWFRDRPVRNPERTSMNKEKNICKYEDSTVLTEFCFHYTLGTRITKLEGEHIEDTGLSFHKVANSMCDVPSEML
jgi:hypothetical protein